MKKSSSAREFAMNQTTSNVMSGPATRMIGIHTGPAAIPSTAASTTVGIPPQYQVARLRMRLRK
jgi:hypothetical protein